MVCGVGRIGQNVKLAVIIGIAVACTFAAPARATDTVIQSIVNSGSQPVPALAVTGITNDVNITSLPFHLQGTVVNLSQIQVYIDGIFSVTIPLAQGMTRFSDNLVFAQGVHAVKLVGISPYANISPTVSFTLTYTPTVINSAVPNESDAANATDSPMSTTSERFGGATISQQASSTQLETHLPSTQQTTLPDWLYRTLVALDIARPGASTVSWPMVERFVVTVAGLSALMFTTVLLGFGRQLFYSWVGTYKEIALCPVHYHSKGYVRGVGLSFILLALFFI